MRHPLVVCLPVPVVVCVAVVVCIAGTVVTSCGSDPGQASDTDTSITTATQGLSTTATGTSTDTTANSDTASSSDTAVSETGSTTATTTTATTLPTSDTSETDETDDTSETGETGEPLPCDDRFAFNPDPPGTGTLLSVRVSDPEPLVYVELAAEGPGQATIDFDDVIAQDPYTWSWNVTDLSEGIWTFTFAAGEPQQQLGSCQVVVLDTGEPPPPPEGDCTGKVCGDDDGKGGTCQTCPMVGTCLDPPSPYGPSPDQSPWECLDNAGCHEESGNCTIWCPGEPCNEEAHPDGCPQGVESCFVSASFNSYEEACKSCCENRFHEPTQEYACWDEAHSLCRYPSDCGLPLWP